MALNAAFYTKNRINLSQALSNGLVVLTGFSAVQRGKDFSHHFEQEASFLWLTGIDEPRWRVIIDGGRGKSWLVAPDVEAVTHLFDGSLSYDEAKRLSGVDTVISSKEADSLLRELARKHSLVYTIGDDPHVQYYDFALNPARKELERQLQRIFADVQDCRKNLAKLRAIKQPEEIVHMKKAINLTIAAFELVRQKLPTLRYEYEIEAEFSYYFRAHGAEGHAYDPIVASGGHATTLHYDSNNAQLKKSQLVLMDVGARYGGYAADITRTYGYGQPTKRQAAIHEAVEQAHADIIGLIKPGVSLMDYSDKSDMIMKQALRRVNLMGDDEDTKVFRKYFPHAISHGLGGDVHESLGGFMEFQPGMVLTVEPGIYIESENIGVRIEDDILVTQTGRDNLSRKLSTALL